MPRYIDAGKYPCKTCGISYCNYNCKKFYEWLNGCDYDMEKVVEQLKEAVEEYVSDYHGVDYIEPDKAIEIVRKGGME